MANDILVKIGADITDFSRLTSQIFHANFLRRREVYRNFRKRTKQPSTRLSRSAQALRLLGLVWLRAYSEQLKPQLALRQK